MSESTRDFHHALRCAHFIHDGANRELHVRPDVPVRNRIDVEPVQRNAILTEALVIARQHPFQMVGGKVLLLIHDRRRVYDSAQLTRGANLAHRAEEIAMSYRCEICGKEPWFGKQVSFSHKRSSRRWLPVSYTHLTLPTIYSV